MQSIRRLLLRVLLLTISTLLLTAVVLAALLTTPQALFTDNILAPGPSLAITPMEQVLLDHLDAATTAIDAALYDFSRVSVRDALIAAANRGVTVRIVTDDDAYTDPDYVPHFQVLGVCQ